MKTTIQRSCLLGLLLSISCIAIGAHIPPRKQNLDFDWRFTLSDDAAYSSKDYNDSQWELVQLPHDWSISLPFDEKAGGAAGHLPGGIGWYRRSIDIPRQWEGRRVHILFDGIFHQSDVYINGHHLGFRPYGFGYIYYDLTPWLIFGGTNSIAVRVDHQDPSDKGARWYTGSGIYRHAWLILTNAIHVDAYGTYVTTRGDEKKAEVSVRTHVVNERWTAGEKASDIVVEQIVTDPAGQRVGTCRNKVPALKDTADVNQLLTITSPRLWTVNDPSLYTLTTRIKKGSRVLDVYQTRFGIRYIEFSSSKGFLLNGQQVKLKGFCLHQDDGCLGTAIPFKAYERRLKAIKAYGCNAVRMSHNPPAPEFLDLCDSLGLLVIDEALDKWKSGYYQKYFDEWWQHDINNMLTRDRNHPSIILWSIGNEMVEAWLENDVGIRRAEMLRDFVHRVEPSRLVNLAGQNRHNGRFSAVADVSGYNYLEKRMLSDHQKNPQQRFVITEELPYYCGDEDNLRSFDENNPWNIISANDFIAGGFIWVGIDYLGEATWPSHGWPSGLFDITLHEKPRAIYHKAMWNEKPVIGIGIMDASLDIDHGNDLWQWPNMADHWSFPKSYEKLIMEVRTTTNCDEVELWLNNNRLGRKQTCQYPNNTIKWNVPFYPGRLMAKAFRQGVLADSCVLVSAYKTTQAQLLPERTELVADGQDVNFINLTLTDDNGQPVQVDDRRIKVDVSGEGRFIGINTGDLRRTEPFNSPTIKTYFGRAQIVVQSTRSTGTIHVNVKIEGLEQEFNCNVKTLAQQ